MNEEIFRSPRVDSFMGLLDKYRKEQGLTCKEIAEAIGVSEVSVNGWLNGTRRPKTLESLWDMVDFLGYEIRTVKVTNRKHVRTGRKRGRPSKEALRSRSRRNKTEEEQ